MIAADRERRDYGHAHRKLRESWRPRVEAGVVCCAKCGRLLDGDEPWDLAHDPLDRTRYLGPMCVRCNRDTRLEKSHRGRRKGGFRWRSPSW